MIAASEGSDDAHLTLLAMLARSLMRAEFLEGLRTATTPQQIVDLVNQATAPDEPATPVAPAAAAAAPVAAADEAAPRKRIVAVTSCPTGIAHTFMAADGLEQAGQGRRHRAASSSRRARARSTWLDPAVIAGADAAIFATDVPVRDRERFAGLPGDRVRREAGHQRAGQAGRRGARRGRQPQRPQGGRHGRPRARRLPAAVRS